MFNVLSAASLQPMAKRQMKGMMSVCFFMLRILDYKYMEIEECGNFLELFCKNILLLLKHCVSLQPVLKKSGSSLSDFTGYLVWINTRFFPKNILVEKKRLVPLRSLRG
jgi:hypothetical protein